MRIKTVVDVAQGHMCAGCGACASAEPSTIVMIDTVREGRRPAYRAGQEGEGTPLGLAICPGLEVGHSKPTPGAIPELTEAWGPVLELWEGYASDPNVRRRGSSGGVATALAVHCLEREGMHGVLHIAARPEAPLLNHTVLSTSSNDVIAAAGSRYAPASPCDALDLIEAAPTSCVFIGKPCDVAATAKLRQLRPALDEKLGLTIGIFCAGTPTLEGTLSMVNRLGIEDPADVEEVRYRGDGWPGEAVVVARVGGERVERRLSYSESWGAILQQHRQWRCYVCADHTGELADIAVGDPWYRPIADGDPGRSLVLVRTERGRKLLAAAVASGAVRLERVAPNVLPASQPNLLHTRGAVWGRTAVLRAARLPAPRHPGMRTFPLWLRLPMRDRAQSIYGTVRRLFTKRLLWRSSLEPLSPQAFQRDGCSSSPRGPKPERPSN